MENKKTVVVVEDEKSLLEVITEKLTNEGFSVVGCMGAQEALDYLSKNNPVDVIWLDYYLKDMDGLEFVKRIRENQTWASIPIVVVSNSASDDKVNSMLALGVEKYLLKANYRLSDIVDIVAQVSGKSKEVVNG